VKRHAALAQRQVERRRLVGPATVVAGGVPHRGRPGEQVELAEQLAQPAERAGAREVEDGSGVAVGDVVEDVVHDVLPQPLLPVSAQVDDRRGPGELAVIAVAVLELVGLDPDRKVGDAVVRAHRGKPIGKRI
jgi:hypothetical protein